MAICGIVVRLGQETAVHADALARLGQIPGLSLGAPTGLKVPAVLDTPSAEEDRAGLERIAALQGIEGVDLVCVHYDDDTGADALGEVGP